MLFSPSAAADLRKRELPPPTEQVSLCSLEGAILFGAGRFTKTLVPILRHHGICPSWVVDNNSALWGDELDGLPIRSRDSLTEAGDRIVVIMTIYMRPMVEACLEAGVRRWAWFTDLQDFFGDLSFSTRAESILGEPEVDRLAMLLEHCSESQDVLRKSLTCRVTGDPADFPSRTDDQYFAANLTPDRGYSYFADCGAFIGDTFQDWLQRYGLILSPGRSAYYAFEPELGNFARLKAVIANLPPEWQSRVIAYPFAVGAEAGRARLRADGSGSGLWGSETDPEVEVVRLDDVLAEHRVTAIKMDLEGYELQALKGASGLIKTQRPVLLIAVYHRVEHLWQIPLWIHDLNLDYRLYLRHHDNTCTETVCYAIPSELSLK
jgi:FkbM family methyltransferase